MRELPKAYEPKNYEDKIYKKWEESGFFNPDVCVAKGITNEKSDYFSMVLPPPNVTGTLHMGHAVMLAIQDVMARYHRMKGEKTLWVPGTDHAAIATQAKVEKLLMEKQRRVSKDGTRHDSAESNPRQELGREKFLAEVKKFAQESHDIIVNQARKMGASLDWSREAFTLDEPRNLAVRTVFKQMYDDGLIYRGYRIINWDPKGQTVISDDEIIYEERKSKFYTFKYGPFEIGTARPETKFGDKYVVMHPDDKRYKKWKHLQKITVEWINGPIEATIIKDQMIDMQFGTGVMTITPWHSHEDFALAEKYKLDKEQIIDKDGKLLSIAGEFAGMKISEAREKIVAKLNAKKLLVSVDENYINRIATAERTGGIIEPQIMKQWFIDVNKPIKARGKKSLKQLMQKAVGNKKGQITIIPDRFEKTYFHWIDNLRDWCISRQIWYGHQIPVWYKSPASQEGVGGVAEEDVYVGVEPPKDIENWQQDPDTLDTWFSSGLWTFSTLGWPVRNKIGFNEKMIEAIKQGEKTKTYRLHNNKGLVVGEVCNAENTQTSKFFGFVKIKSITQTKIKDVVLNQVGHESYANHDELVQELQKFSPDVKVDSKSDVWVYEFTYQEKSDIELYHPTSVMETGYDILFFWVARMILMTTYILGDIPFKTVYLHGLVRDEQGRKMSKSLGNVINPLDMIAKYGTDATRLSLLIGNTPGNDMKLSEEKIAGFRNFTNKLWNISRFMLMNIENPKKEIKNPKPITLADKWILAKLENVAASTTENIEKFNFSLAGEKLRDFTWGDLADWYLEITKVEGGKSEILNYILNTILKLWHPYMPFVTETIWREIYSTDKMLMVESWPVTSPSYQEGVGGVAGDGVRKFEIITNVITGIRSLRAENKIEPAKKIGARVNAGSKEKLLKDNEAIIKSLARLEKLEFVKSGAEVALDLTGAIDMAKEKARLEKEIQELKKYVGGLENKLANKEFVKNAPKEVVAKEQGKLSEAKSKLEKLNNQLQ